jgi:hypothetical protein
MNRLRTWFTLLLAMLFVPILHADDKPVSTAWATDRTLTVSPQAAPVPAFKYRLFPLSSTLKEGNAVPIYLRLIHEQSDATRKYWTETPKAWNELPIDKIPKGEAQKFLQSMHYFLRQFDLGARRSSMDWSYTLDAGNPIGLLLPDAQNMRNFAPMMILQVRTALAQRDFSQAAHHLETGFAFSRQSSQAPTLIHSMVGLAVASQFTGCVADFLEQPSSPNLYWALTAMPRPFFDLRIGYEWEYRMIEMQFPELDDLDRDRTSEAWDKILRRIRTEIRAIATIPGDEKTPPKLMDIFTKDYAPDEPAFQSPDLPAARRFVARTKGLSAEKVEAMAASQVLLMYLVGQYHEYRDDSFRAIYLPYTQRQAIFDAANKRLQEKPTSEGHQLARVLLPALFRVSDVQARFERNLAALRIVEALRMYTAFHNGQLPEKLTDVTEVPIPLDPTTGQPFEYSCQDGIASIISKHVPGARQEGNGLRYKVVIQKN